MEKTTTAQKTGLFGIIALIYASLKSAYYYMVGISWMPSKIDPGLAVEWAQEVASLFTAAFIAWKAYEGRGILFKRQPEPVPHMPDGSTVQDWSDEGTMVAYRLREGGDPTSRPRRINRYSDDPNWKKVEIDLDPDQS